MKRQTRSRSKKQQETLQSPEALRKRGESADSDAAAVRTVWGISYNAVSFCGWAWVLYKACNQLWLTHDLSLVHASVKTLLQEVQSLAVVEIGLIALGISKSNLATTIMQVFSRLLLVWGILNSFPEVAVSPWAAVMILAWAVTEIIRYAYYALHMMGIQNRTLLWARYTTFYVLYPIGAGSEWWLIQLAMPQATKIHQSLRIAMLVISACYPPAFMKLYTHMIKQRAKYLTKKPQKRS